MMAVSDGSVKAEEKVCDDFAGVKIQMENLIGKKVFITRWQRDASIKHPGTNYYKLQLIYKADDGQDVLAFMTCGAKQIVEVLDKKTDKIPLKVTFVQYGKAFYFKEYMASDQEALMKVIEEFGLDTNELL